jgi:hypothetical protein
MSSYASAGNITLAPAGGKILCSGKILDEVGMLTMASPVDVVVYVSSAGNDVTGTGAVGAPYLTLPRAFKQLAQTGWDRSATVVIASAAYTLPAGQLQLEPGSFGLQQYPVNIVGGAGTFGRTSIATSTLASATSYSLSSRLSTVSATANIFTTTGVGNILRFNSGPLASYAPSALSDSSPAAALGGIRVEAYVTRRTIGSSNILALSALFGPSGADLVAAAGNSIELLVNATTVTVPVGVITVKSAASKIVWRNLDFQFAGATAGDFGSFVFDGVDTEMYGVRVAPFTGSFGFKNVGATGTAGGYSVNSGYSGSDWQQPSILGVCIQPRNSASTVIGTYTHSGAANSSWQYQNSLFYGTGAMQGDLAYRGCIFNGNWGITASNSRVSLTNCNFYEDAQSGLGGRVQSLTGGATALCNVHFNCTFSTGGGEPAVSALGGDVSITSANVQEGVRFDNCRMAMYAERGKLRIEGIITVAGGAAARTIVGGGIGGDIVMSAAAPAISGTFSAPFFVLNKATLRWSSALSSALPLTNGLLSMNASSATFTGSIDFPSAVLGSGVVGVSLVNQSLLQLSYLRLTDSGTGAAYAAYALYSRIEAAQGIALTTGSAGTVLAAFGNSVISTAGALSVTSNSSTGTALALEQSSLNIGDNSLTVTPLLNLTGGALALRCTQSEVHVQGNITTAFLSGPGAPGRVLVESGSTLHCEANVSISVGAVDVFALTVTSSSVYARGVLTASSLAGSGFFGASAQMQFGRLACTGVNRAIQATAGSTLAVNEEAVAAGLNSIAATVSSAASANIAMHCNQSTVKAAIVLVTGAAQHGLFLENDAQMACTALTCSALGANSDAIRLEDSRLTVKTGATSATAAGSNAHGIYAKRSKFAAAAVTAASTLFHGIYLLRSEFAAAAVTATACGGRGFFAEASNCTTRAFTATGNAGSNLYVAQGSTLRCYGATAGTAVMSIANTPLRASMVISNGVVTQDSQLYVDGAINASGSQQTSTTESYSGLEVRKRSKLTADTFTFIGLGNTTDSDYGLQVAERSHVHIRSAISDSVVRGARLAGLFISGSTFNINRPVVGGNASLALANGRLAGTSAANGGGVYITDGSQGVLDSANASYNYPCGIAVDGASSLLLTSNVAGFQINNNVGAGLVVRNGSTVSASLSTAAAPTWSIANTLRLGVETAATGVGHGMYLYGNAAFAWSADSAVSITGNAASAIFADFRSDLTLIGNFTITGVAGITLSNSSTGCIRRLVSGTMTITGSSAINVVRNSTATIEGVTGTATGATTYGVRILSNSQVSASNTNTVAGATGNVFKGSAAVTWALVNAAGARFLDMTDYSNTGTTTSQMCTVTAKP